MKVIDNNNILTAKNVRKTTENVNMFELLLGKVNSIIVNDAEKGRHKSIVYVEDFQYNTIKEVKEHFENIGFDVRLKNIGWKLKWVNEFTKLEISW